jgi:hypothetical protein
MEPLHLRKGKKVASSIEGRSRRQCLQLKSIGKGNEIYRKTIRLEVVLKMWNWTLWRGRLPLKWKKNLVAVLT